MRTSLCLGFLLILGTGVIPAADSKAPPFDKVVSTARKQKKLVLDSVHQDG